MRMIQPLLMTDTEFTSSNIPEDDETEWSDSTSYTAGDKAMIATQYEGVDYHMVYECVTANTNKFPPDYLTGDPIYWKQLYRTNRWRMWDDKSRSVSSKASPIVVRVTPGLLFNSTALLNLKADALNVRVNDPTAGDVYDEDIEMIDLAGIDDFYEWFFSPLKWRTDVALLDLPAYPDAYIEITVENTGVNVEVGEWVIGNLKVLGSAEYPYKVQTDNFSVKSTDPGDGYPQVTENLYIKLVNFSFLLDANKVVDIERTIGVYLNVPAVYIGYLGDVTDVAQETIVFGYIKSNSIKVQSTGTNNAEGKLKIEELS